MLLLYKTFIDILSETENLDNVFIQILCSKTLYVNDWVFSLSRDHFTGMYKFHL